MAIYNIKDLENLSGIKAHTIRIWEKRYNIVSPSRTDTNFRTYDDDDLRRLLNISILNNHGIKISNLAKLSDAEIRDKVLFISQNPSDFNTQIESLVLAMLNLDEGYFHQIFNKSVMVNGFEKTMEDIVIKTMERVGFLWLSGTINPAQEHFISNLIRQKLISNIDSLPNTVTPHAKKFLLFMPEGEMHELSLLYSYYLIKKHGHNVLYFGQQTPIQAVKDSEKLWNADYLIISMVVPMEDSELQNFIHNLQSNFSDKKIFLMGSQGTKLNLFNFSNLSKLFNINDLTSFLNTI